MTKSRYPLDPQDEDEMQTVEQGLSQALTPIELPPERSNPLRTRLLARVAKARQAGTGFIRAPLSRAEWRRILPGVRLCRLDARQRAFIVELAPGASLPVHRHHQDEECIVLSGEARLGEVVVRQGDYHLARSNSRHGRVTSDGGALLFLRGAPLDHGGELLRDLVTALLPGDGDAPLTVRSDEGTWSDRGDGVRAKLLREDGSSRSQLLRVPVGSRPGSDLGAFGEECLLLEGDLSLDDWAMQPGDYQVACAGAGHAEISSTGGALLFVRGPV